MQWLIRSSFVSNLDRLSDRSQCLSVFESFSGFNCPPDAMDALVHIHMYNVL